MNTTYKYELREEEVFCGIQTMYDNIAVRMGYEPCKVKAYDCKRILVSNDIFEKIYEWYRQERNIGMDEMGMIWVCWGPKCDDSLKGYEVVVEEKFIEEVER